MSHQLHAAAVGLLLASVYAYDLRMADGVPPRDAGQSQGVVAFVGVNVVPMDSERVLDGQTVLVRDGVVSEIAPIAEVAIPAEAAVIYGRGRYLVPGLIDMHVHIRAEDLPRYIENGITTVRDLAGLDSVLAAMRRVERGEVLGPRILPSSRLLDGPNPVSPQFATVVPSPSDRKSTRLNSSHSLTSRMPSSA